MGGVKSSYSSLLFVLITLINPNKLIKLRIQAEYPEGLSNQIEEETEADADEEHVVLYQFAGLWDGSKAVFDPPVKTSEESGSKMYLRS